MEITRGTSRRATALISVALVAAALLLGQPAQAGLLDSNKGPSAGGISSDNVEHIAHIPLSVDGVGGRVVGKYFYTNDQHKIMIFDIHDPLNPVLTDTEPLPQEVLLSREDLDTNGEILIMPNSITSSLRIYDVEDKANITLLADLPGGNSHTHSCILNCTYAYGSNGQIVDLRDPTKPKILKQKWGDGKPTTSGHDVEEIARGMVLTATQPIMLLDARKDPTRPKLLATGANTDGRFIHTGRWPQNGTDKFLLMAGETNFKPRCNEASAAFMTWDASKWRKTHTFTMIDEYRSSNGTYADGSPAANISCSTHWHEASPKFDNGGIVASAMFEHGTRFIDVSSKGQIKEIGWFLPHAGSTSAVYWVTPNIVYAVDYTRGIDILRFTGKQ
jgi:hypothetical protein